MAASCAHDLERPVRLGRASYACRLCGNDISLELVFLWEALTESEREQMGRQILAPGHPDVKVPPKPR